MNCLISTCLALTPHAYNVYTLLTNARGIIHCPLFYVGMYTFNARVVKLTVLICRIACRGGHVCVCTHNYEAVSRFSLQATKTEVS